MSQPFYVQVYLAAILVLFALQATLTTAVPLETEAVDQLDPADAALAEEDLAEEEDALDEAELDAEDQAIEGRGRPWWSFGVQDQAEDRQGKKLKFDSEDQAI